MTFLKNFWNLKKTAKKKNTTIDITGLIKKKNQIQFLFFEALKLEMFH